MTLEGYTKDYMIANTPAEAMNQWPTNKALFEAISEAMGRRYGFDPAADEDGEATWEHADDLYLHEFKGADYAAIEELLEGLLEEEYYYYKPEFDREECARAQARRASFDCAA